MVYCRILPIQYQLLKIFFIPQMHAIFTVLLVFLPLCLSQTFSPYDVGPHQVVSMSFNATTYPELITNLDVWGPQEAGSYPILYFLDSFGAITPGQTYGIVSNFM